MNKLEQRQIIQKLLTHLRSERGVVQVRMNEPCGGCDKHTNDLLRARDQARLKDIERALARMDNNTYGVCEACHAEIWERLEARPEARYCVACQGQVALRPAIGYSAQPQWPIRSREASYG